MCQRRLASYRGLKDDGSPNLNPGEPLKAAILVQDADGDVRWAAGSCADPTKKIAKVANDTDAADLTKYVNRLIAKGDDHCDLSLAGSDDVNSGQWKLVWVASLQKWTTVPDTGEGSVNTDLCTTLEAGIVVDPGTSEYVLNVSSSGHMALGVSLKVATYEFVVTEIIADDYVRAELVTTIYGPATVAAGETICNIGFRPCPRATAPYADNLITCLNNSPVAIDMPDDVNDVAVPGLWWRNQLGRIQFLAAPVNATTGIIEPGYVLKTPVSPSAGGTNTPSFQPSSQAATWLNAKVAVASKFVGTPSPPSFAIEDDVVSVSPHTGTFDMDGGSIPGYTAGKSVAVCRAVVYSDSGLGSTESHAQVIVNGLVLLESWIDSATAFAFQQSNVFEVPLTNDTFTYSVVAAGDALAFAKLEVIGFK